MDVILAGEVDESCSDDVYQIIVAVIDTGPARITVDLRGLVFIDDAGVAAFVGAHRSAQAHRTSLIVANARGQVRQALSSAGVLRR
ncbi:STAS domain-containing protein [Dactylosporangium sp. CS-047395]|uniref:STAS domain-containing protein n=1 Tax=Dactylosporangium sp. CS-047395 TaxID=3239936 RepID=UPI003D8C5765